MKQFRSRDRVEEVDRTVRGGAALILDSRDDLAGLQVLCAERTQSSRNPMADIYREITRPDLQGRVAELRTRASDHNTGIEALISAPETGPQRDAIDLRRMLYIVSQIWGNQDGPDMSDVRLVVAVPRPTWRPFARLRLSKGAPGLVMHQGSLTAMVSCKAIRVAGPLVGLFLGTGVGAKTAEAFINSLRAEASRSAGFALPRIDAASKEPPLVPDKAAIVVFVHGLLGTDVGTFDGFISSLRTGLVETAEFAAAQEVADFGVAAVEARFPPHGLRIYPEEPGGREKLRSLIPKAVAKAVNETVTFVGWPHDTLIGIEDNGLQLAEDLEHLVAPDGDPSAGPDVIFVCHSRGGLVARSAIAELIGNRNKNWRRKIKGCLTFGTPHEGAVLAQLPARLAGMLLLGAMLVKARSVSSLPAALNQLCRDEIPGIADLRPIGRGSHFLKGLKKAEARAGTRIGPAAPPLLAIGGRYERDTAFAWLASRALAKVPNDLVVDIKSSAPDRFSRRAFADCHHFGYADITMPGATEFVCTQLGLPEAITARALATLRSILDGADVLA